MKIKWLGLGLIGALALAGSVAGATYTDNAANYAEAPGWVDGSNGGTGFGPWSIEAVSEGGWAGAGIWNSAGAGLSMGEAFGYVGKVGHVTINRSFLQALNVGDSFAFDFGVNWDSDGGNKGFSLFANGVEVINVNHGGFPGEITMNGAPALVEYGTETMRWTFTQEAADQIAVHATGRDGVETFSSTVTVVNGYGYLGSVRFYSSGLASDAPDQRQSYFDNLTLEQEGTPPPDPMGLNFISGTWNPAAVGVYSFELAREGAVGNDIVLSSSNEDAVTVPETVSFLEGVDVLTFDATVVSLTSGPATIVASNAASGMRAEYVITPVAPSLSIDGPFMVYAHGPQTYTLTRVGAVGNTIVLSSSNTDVLTVPASVTFPSESDQTTFIATIVGNGFAWIYASNVASGATAEYGVSVAPPSMSLLGATSLSVGQTRTYFLMRNGPVGQAVNLESTASGVLLVPATAEFGFDETMLTFQVEALAEGTTTLRAFNDDAESNVLTIEVTESRDFVAYDDASLYDGGVWAFAPTHQTGFSDWTEVLSPELADSYRGRFIAQSPIAGINEDNAAFALYANWSGETEPSPLPEIKMIRHFPGPMTEGQLFSVDVGYDWSGGTKGFKLKGEYDGVAYDRLELFSSGNDTWSYKLDGDDSNINVVWDGYVPGGFMGRVQVLCMGDNTFSFSFQREGEEEIVLRDVVLPGSIDQIEFYNYNGGSGSNQDFYFNRMWLTRGSEPEPGPGVVALTYSAATKQFSFGAPEGYSIGTIEAADCAMGANGDWANWRTLVAGVDYVVDGNGNVTLQTDELDVRMIIRVRLIED